MTQEAIEKLTKVVEFANKVSKAMDDSRSSHVYYILQQAYPENGDWEWSEFQALLTEVTGYRLSPDNLKERIAEWLENYSPKHNITDSGWGIIPEVAKERYRQDAEQLLSLLSTGEPPELSDEQIDRFYMDDDIPIEIFEYKELFVR